MGSAKRSAIPPTTCGHHVFEPIGMKLLVSETRVHGHHLWRMQSSGSTLVRDVRARVTVVRARGIRATGETSFFPADRSRNR